MEELTPELLFYDGHCGLCHRTVAFVLARDPEGVAFRFAPLGGETFERQVPAELRVDLPDSVVVWKRDGELLARSRAVLHVLRRLGGGWWLLAGLLSLVPRRLLDVGYDQLALRRKRWFGEREESCPVVPARLRGRFEA